MLIYHFYKSMYNVQCVWIQYTNTELSSKNWKGRNFKLIPAKLQSGCDKMAPSESQKAFGGLC